VPNKYAQLGLSANQLVRLVLNWALCSLLAFLAAAFVLPFACLPDIESNPQSHCSYRPDNGVFWVAASQNSGALWEGTFVSVLKMHSEVPTESAASYHVIASTEQDSSAASDVGTEMLVSHLMEIGEMKVPGWAQNDVVTIDYPSCGTMTWRYAYGWPFLCATGSMSLKPKTALEPRLWITTGSSLWIGGPDRDLPVLFPLTPMITGVVLNGLVYSLSIAVVSLLWTQLQKWVWRRRRRCIACGYSTNNLENRRVCTECGNQIVP